MNVIYNPKTDTLSVVFKEGTVAESDEDKPGVILDYDAEGRLLGLEILDASRHVTNPEGIAFRVA